MSKFARDRKKFRRQTRRAAREALVILDNKSRVMNLDRAYAEAMSGYKTPPLGCRIENA